MLVGCYAIYNRKTPGNFEKLGNALSRLKFQETIRETGILLCAFKCNFNALNTVKFKIINF